MNPTKMLLLSLVLVVLLCSLSVSGRPRPVHTGGWYGENRHARPTPKQSPPASSSILSAGRVADPMSPVYIWPMPQSVTNGMVTRDLAYPFSITSSPSFNDIEFAIARTNRIIFTHHPGNSGSDALSGLSITIDNPSVPLQLGVDESYTLVIPSDPSQGAATLTANTYYGALQGLETFSQLVNFNFTEDLYQISSTPWTIKDFPRFSHRGMLLDTSRHFEPIPTIRQFVDSIAYAKYNVFHWHLSDSQSFPLHLEALPLFSQAAWSPQERYTENDVRDMVEYCRLRGIRLMIEFDVPGHARSWCVGYPDVCPAANCTTPLDPSTNATFDLMTSLFHEITGGAPRQGLVPEDLFHLGGDEVDLSCYTNVAHVNDWLKRTNRTQRDAYYYIVERAHDIIYANGRIPVNWDEVWANFGKTIDPRTIIHVWRLEEIVRNATRDGFRVLVSPDGPWYMDGLATTWKQMYELEPAAGITDPAQLALVLGGEATMWGETVDTSDVFSTTWPRAAAVAERLWSPITVNNVTLAEPRYVWFRCLLNSRGIGAQPYNSTSGRQAPAGPGSCYQSDHP